ncbi:hypothetical protein TREMEDRAFT_71310 [Tremella mesenterica DSM 1558]|uniref:uncharacterized protein n=1 Tax=Tremella mesenterica (strain ATCC 24925 / CBS 8224 / DSM 1558 / NBRC 9311 / NRRL Y-6157 / RJB 2259-6 / UBC 559-6) TaxID=578456 RepID=UPI0003F48FA0|nr:uncharacterized protein TREMEDRAFT_71310 [Tremella mesenterica DSM 1558]EIW70463.1 hypothetical protein TREMEDRAFT_71310 [Tremella mesenterica DSM 1558]
MARKRSGAKLVSASPSLLAPTLPFSLQDAITHLSLADPRFGNMFQHLPCKPYIPPYTAIDPFRTLVTSIIGQQVSWMAARAINGRFRALFGYEDENGFPSPAQVAATEVQTLKGVGLSTRKAEYVISLAEHFLSGQLSTELLRDGSDDQIAKALIAVRGIGQWTVDMFLMFSLKRPDVLPVGDLGVQKGLIRWVLAAHQALPRKKGKNDAKVDRVDEDGGGEIDTRIQTPPPLERQYPQTPHTPSNASVVRSAVLHTPIKPTDPTPPTPITPLTAPAETLEVPDKELPPPTPQELLAPIKGHEWDANKAAPLSEGLSVEVLKTRMGGKKVKGGAYLTPGEMEALTQHWRPFRSLGVYYMWPAGEDF